MILRTTAVLAAMLAAPSCSPSSRPEGSTTGVSGRECFFLSEISGYHYAGRDTIHVSTGPNETYEFKTLGPCPDLDYGEAIAFDQTSPGTICRGIDVTLVVPSSIGPQRCPVSMIRKLPPPAK
jgi:hypothetical protein